MLLARQRIARQLADQPGLVRYASGISSPTEFFTLTVWENRESMQRFMQTGAHEELMWHFTRWTSNFWGMRWEPGPRAAEIGTWDGLRLSDLQANPPPRSPLIAAGLLPPNTPRAGPLGPRPEVSAREPRGSGIFAVIARYEGARAALGAMRRSLREPSRDRTSEAAAVGGDPQVRCGCGVDWPPQALSITLWHNEPGAPERAITQAQAAGAVWAMCWQPADYEIGHWNGLRLRQSARRRARKNAR